jgi:hypothetical protein
MIQPRSLTNMQCLKRIEVLNHTGVMVGLIGLMTEKKTYTPTHFTLTFSLLDVLLINLLLNYAAMSSQYTASNE